MLQIVKGFCFELQRDLNQLFQISQQDFLDSHLHFKYGNTLSKKCHVLKNCLKQLCFWPLCISWVFVMLGSKACIQLLTNSESCLKSACIAPW